MTSYNALSFFILLGKQGKIVEYYKKQERLLEGFNEMETIHESGGLPGRLTEVCFFDCVDSVAAVVATIIILKMGFRYYIIINNRFLGRKSYFIATHLT